MNKRPTRLGRPPKQEARNTRECILAAAIELAARQGFTGTSLRQIAQAVGIKESAIYAHFENKEALCRVIFERFGPPVVDLPEPDDLASITQDQVGAVLCEIARGVIARWDEPHARMFLSLALREGITSGSSLLRPAKQRVLEQFVPIMRQWIEQGYVRGDFPPEHLAWELFAPLFLIRVAYWHAQATEAECKQGHHLADLHIEYFLRTVLILKTDNAPEKEW